MGLWLEFKKFAVRGNIMDLAIGVVIGGAFGKIVSSLVDDVFMPLINPLIPDGRWQTLTIWPGIKIGSFAAALLNFLVIAFALFLVLKLINSIRKKEAETPAAPAAPNTTDKLLMEIRDALVARKES